MNANELADEIQERMNGLNTNDDVRVFDYAAAELRRLHEVNQDLLEALKRIAAPNTLNADDRVEVCREALREIARAVIANTTGE
jgi:hypothetical protein